MDLCLQVSLPKLREKKYHMLVLLSTCRGTHLTGTWMGNEDYPTVTTLMNELGLKVKTLLQTRERRYSNVPNFAFYGSALTARLLKYSHKREEGKIFVLA